MPNSAEIHPSSYRDPSGFVFRKDGRLYRQINQVFQNDFELFINSGCYQQLVNKALLISHERINENLTGSENWYTTILPEKIRFISYPYEWSFDMLRDAALLTLTLLKESLAFGLILKDATPYNIQWHEGRLIFIDTLSFEKYESSQPWIAYRQFCETFLAPLLLMHYHRLPLHPFSLAYPEGVPLKIASSMLPWRSRFSLNTYLHIHLHAAISGRPPAKEQKKVSFSKQKLLNLTGSLESLIGSLHLPPSRSTWSAYYEEASTRDEYLLEKKKIVADWVSSLTGIEHCMDLGANDGEFAKITAGHFHTIAADFDPNCINRLYREIVDKKEKNIQPLLIDLANPSPAIGVNNEERDSFIGRSQTDLVLALALVHHLAIGRNIPFTVLVDFFEKITTYLLIEFIPKEDEKIRLMLAGRKDIYNSYDGANFESSFAKKFRVIKRQAIAGSGRLLYLYQRKEG